MFFVSVSSRSLREPETFLESAAEIPAGFARWACGVRQFITRATESSTRFFPRVLGALEGRAVLAEMYFVAIYGRQGTSGMHPRVPYYLDEA